MVTAPSLQRRQALDVARGTAVLFVVVFHSLLFAEAVEAWSTPWRAVVGLFRLLPVPLLLLVSGFLARRTLSSTALTLRRAGLVLGLYTLATTVFVLLFWRVGYVRQDADTVFTPGALPAELLLPSTYLWYLYGVGLALLLVRATHRLPAAVVVAAALALSVAAMAGWIGTGSDQVDDLLAYLVFFVVGARAPRAVERVLALGGRPAGRALVLVYLVTAVGTIAAVMAGLCSTWDLDALPLVGPATAALSVAAALCAAVELEDRAVGRTLARLGGSTLPIYLGHEPVLALIVMPLGPVLAGTAGAARHLVVPGLAAAGLGVPTLAGVLVHRVRTRPGAGHRRAVRGKSTSSPVARRGRRRGRAATQERLTRAATADRSHGRSEE